MTSSNNSREEDFDSVGTDDDFKVVAEDQNRSPISTQGRTLRHRSLTISTSNLALGAKASKKKDHPSENCDENSNVVSAIDRVPFLSKRSPFAEPLTPGLLEKNRAGNQRHDHQLFPLLDRKRDGDRYDSEARGSQRSSGSEYDETSDSLLASPELRKVSGRKNSIFKFINPFRRFSSPLISTHNRYRSNSVISNSSSRSVVRKKNRLNVHPITLLPAFILGFLIASFYEIWWGPSNLRSTSSLFNSSPFNRFDWSILSSTQNSKSNGEGNKIFVSEPVKHYRDYVYFPKNYLDQRWTIYSNRSTSSSNEYSDKRKFKKRENAKDEKNKKRIYPLIELINNASVEWDLKVSKQSKNLKAGVREYQRRYKRLPPRGFKEWFEWCLRNKVVLVDEFDRINELIEPFWSLPPHILRNRSEEVGKEESCSTFLIKDGKVKAIGSQKDKPRSLDQLKLLNEFSKFLPDVNFTISHHDGPSVFLDFKTKQKHLDYSRSGKTLPPEEIDKVEDDASLWGFVGSCSPDSPMRMYSNGMLNDLDDEIKGLKGGYIGLDHSKTMDLCNHPEWKELHGFTSWQGPRPGLLRPTFSFAQSSSFVSDLLNVPLEQFEDVKKNQQDFRPFKNKTESRTLLWKGQTTGIWFDRTTNWRQSHRVRLHRLGKAFKKDYGDKLSRNIRIVKKKLKGPEKRRREKVKNGEEDEGEEGEEELIEVIEKSFSLKELSKNFLTASFVGKLVQCTTEDGSCETVKDEFEFDPYVDWNYQNNFKYVLDVDGNSWSGRFRRLLASNSLVFKSTIWPEWYRDQIQAWYHYIPVRIDYEDLFDLLSFFTGSRELVKNLKDDDQKKVEGGGEEGYDFQYFEDLAEKIANQGTDWVKNHFRFEDLQAYQWRSLLEWARVSSDDRLNSNFDL